MGTVWECIRGLVESNKSYAMKLRLVCMYQSLSFRKRDVQSIECVFHDEKEDRIQVTFPKSVMQNFKDVLEEGQIFGVKNFKLLINSRKYRVTTSKFRIVVHDLMQIRPIFVAQFPNKRFWFQSFHFVHQLEEDTVDDVALLDVVLDVMGALIDMGNIQPKTTTSGTEKKILDIVLQDNEERLLHCTLWDEFAEQADALLRLHTTDPIIVVLQLCKPNVYREAVNNVLHATKLFVNPEIEEVLDFADRYVAKFGKKPTLSGGASQGAAPSFDEDYVEGVSTKKSIIQLFDDDCEESSYVPRHNDPLGDAALLTSLGTPLGQQCSGEIQPAEHDDDDNSKFGTPMSATQSTTSPVLVVDDRDCVSLGEGGAKRCLAKTFADVAPLKKKRKYTKKDKD